MTGKIALFINHPECSKDCCDGIIAALSPKYDIKLFSKEECNPSTFNDVDIVAFPGGIGDSERYNDFFKRKAENAVADFVERGGRYLGICMGAYWAGSFYFDILDSVEPTQYIKRPGADIRRPYGTYATVLWKGTPQDMYFYDGCSLVGDPTKFDTIATYANGDPMAIIQGRIGLIGCHPESQKHWYEKPWQYLTPKWHSNAHHRLLLEFVDDLMLR